MKYTDGRVVTQHTITLASKHVGSGSEPIILSTPLTARQKMVLKAISATIAAALVCTAHAGLIAPLPITGPFKLNEVTNTSMACGEDLGQARYQHVKQGGSFEAQFHRDYELDYGGYIGGFIRWALAPIESTDDYPSASDFDNNVLQYSCHEALCELYEPKDGKAKPFYELSKLPETTKDDETIRNGWVCKDTVDIPESLPTGLYKFQFTRFGAGDAVTKDRGKSDSTENIARLKSLKPAPPQRTCGYLKVGPKDEKSSSLGSGPGPSSSSGLDSMSGSLDSIDGSGSDSNSVGPGTTHADPATDGNDDGLNVDGKKGEWHWGATSSTSSDDSKGGSNADNVDAGDADSTDTGGGLFDTDDPASASDANSNSVSVDGSHSGSGPSLASSHSSSGSVGATPSQNSKSRSDGNLKNASGSDTDDVAGDKDANNKQKVKEVTVRRLQDGSKSGGKTKLDLGCPKNVRNDYLYNRGSSCAYAFTNKIEIVDGEAKDLEKFPFEPFKPGTPADIDPGCD